MCFTESLKEIKTKILLKRLRKSRIFWWFQCHECIIWQCNGTNPAFKICTNYKNTNQFFSKINTVYQISHLPKVLVLASAGQTDEEEFQNFILNCDPYYKRHLQKLPESKHKTSAPEIEEELKTAFELYSNVCESFFNYFLFSLIIRHKITCLSR